MFFNVYLIFKTGYFGNCLMLQMSENRTYLNMIEAVLQTPYLYFSYTYDVTHTLQRLQHTPPEFLKVGKCCE